jgi:predicted GIY-YIG superfamily endonuclease
MDKARILREIMVKGESLTTKEIALRIKNEYPQEWAEKAEYYLSKGEDEKFVISQLRGEIGATFYSSQGGWVNLGRIKREKNENGVWVYTITSEYQSFLMNATQESFLDTETDNSNGDNYESTYEECDDCLNEYFVYLMKSSIFSNTYKIGFTDNLSRREKELLSPSNKVYNVFDFKVCLWTQLTDKSEMEQMEKNLHSYFFKNRLFQKNGSAINTEIFINNNLEKLFTEFVRRNYLDDSYKKGVVVKYNLI